MNNEKPFVGMGATVCHWSDRTACTIVEVFGKTILLQEDQATRIDNNGMSEIQSYNYNPDPDGRIFKATLRKDGRYRISKSTETVVLGERHKYYDYSF